MKREESLLIDVLSILPQVIDCYIQAPSLEDEVILSMMNASKFDYYKLIKLNDTYKKKFIERIKNNLIVEYFQSIEIRNNDTLLFEGHDGVEFGIISKNIIMPEWFIEKYIKTEMCIISKDW